MTPAGGGSDPGLLPTGLSASPRCGGGPRVGTRFRFPLRRFSRDPAFERVFAALHRGFGPQEWWPARTPFEVIVGAVLAQNTAWRNVELALGQLAPEAPPTPRGLLDLDPAALEARVRPAGTYRAKAATLVTVAGWYLDAGGLDALRRRPLGALRDELLGLRGVGPETADSILCYAAGRRTPVVDVYARRVLGRHGLGPAEAPYGVLRAWLMESLVDSQAVYEEFHALVVRAGYNHCKPRPRCETCPAPTPPIPS